MFRQTEDVCDPERQETVSNSFSSPDEQHHLALIELLRQLRQGAHHGSNRPRRYCHNNAEEYDFRYVASLRLFAEEFFAEVAEPRRKDRSRKLAATARFACERLEIVIGPRSVGARAVRQKLAADVCASL